MSVGAQVSLVADVSSILRADQALDSLVATALRTERATDRLRDASGRFASATNAAGSAAETLATQIGRVPRATDQLTASFATLDKGLTAIVRGLHEGATATATMAARADALRAQLDPLAASQQKVARATAEANALLRAGGLTQIEHADLVGRATKAHAELEARVMRSGRAAGLSKNDWTNLNYQINDATTMALSGASVITQGVCPVAV